LKLLSTIQLLRRPYGIRARLLKELHRTSFFQQKIYAHSLREVAGEWESEPHPFSFILGCSSERHLNETVQTLVHNREQEHHQVILWRTSTESPSPVGEFSEVAGGYLDLSGSPPQEVLARCEHDWIIYLHEASINVQGITVLSQKIKECPESWLIYSDELYSDSKLRKYKLLLKGDWDLYRFLASSYLGPSWCMRKDVALGYCAASFSEILETSVMAQVRRELDSVKNTDSGIEHLASTLFHYYTQSSAQSSWMEELRSLLKRIFPPSNLIPISNGQYSNCSTPAKSTPNLPALQELALLSPVEEATLDQTLPKVSVILPTRDQLPFLRQAASGLLESTDYAPMEVVILDNDSKEPETLEWMRQIEQAHEQVRVLSQPGDFNFSRFNNQAVAQTEGSLVLLLNNDIEILHPDWLQQMVKLLQNPQVGIVGARLLYPEGTIQHAGIAIDDLGNSWHLHFGESLASSEYAQELSFTRQVSANTGACLLIRREVWDFVGGMDEQFAVYCNDVDLCLRVKEAGWKVLWTPLATLVHHESVTLKRPSPALRDQNKREKQIFAERWRHYREPWPKSLEWPFVQCTLRELLKPNP
jgi:GT2 family glycosyltransferase